MVNWHCTVLIPFIGASIISPPHIPVFLPASSSSRSTGGLNLVVVVVVVVVVLTKLQKQYKHCRSRLQLVMINEAACSSMLLMQLKQLKHAIDGASSRWQQL